MHITVVSLCTVLKDNKSIQLFYANESDELFIRTFSCLFSGQRCAHHKHIYEEKINRLCKHVRCEMPDVKELCPKECKGKSWLDVDFKVWGAMNIN